MPHVRRSMLIWVDADCERVQRALVDELGLVAVVAVLDRDELELGGERALDALAVGVDPDQHRAPHVRHATASPSRGEF